MLINIIAKGEHCNDYYILLMYNLILAMVNRWLFLLVAALALACSDNRERSQNFLVFRYNESKGITSLDPAYAKSLALIWPVHQLYNGLVQLSDSLRVEPCIAKCWEISGDGLKYTFTLRNDVYFCDSEVFPSGLGRRVVASDFVYSLNRVADPQTASPGAWTLSALDRNKAGGGCVAVNDSTLSIYLSNPFPAFLGLLSMPYCYVVPHEAIARYGKDFRSHPVGTGPFYLKYWKEGERLILRRNPKYFETNGDGRRLPYLEAINISFIADKQSEFLEFMQGNLDFLSGVHPASKDELLTRTGELNPEHTGKIRMITGPYLNTEYLGVLLDSTAPGAKGSPLLNVNIRRAIGHGFDRTKMMMYLRGNMGYPATRGFVPGSMPGFSHAIEGFSYNPDKSRELLAKAGYPEGKGLPPITISTTDDYLDLCEFIQHQLNELGFKIEVEVFPGAAYRDMMANSKLALFRGSWVADYADPENYLALFYSPNFAPSGPNYTHFKSPGYDGLYQKSLVEPDEQKRLKYYLSMDSMVIANAAVIPLYYDKVVRFTRVNVQGLGSNPMNLLVLKNVSKDSITK